MIAAGGVGGASFVQLGVNASTGSSGTLGNPGAAGGTGGSAFSEGAGEEESLHLVLVQCSHLLEASRQLLSVMLVV